MYKSVIAIVIGIIVSFATSAFIGLLFGLALSGSGMEALLSPTFITAVLVGSAAGSVAGGSVTARRAPSSPLMHSLIFGLINGFLSMGSAMPSEVRQLQFLAAVVLAIFGGWISSPRHKAAPSIAKSSTIPDRSPPTE